MHVNDAPNADLARSNCGALCTIAGILETTAEIERENVKMGAGGGEAPYGFEYVEYAVQMGRAPRNSPHTLIAQALGIADWMSRVHGYQIAFLGSPINPLQKGELQGAMLGRPEGTCFAYLIVDCDTFAAGNAHWIAAQKRNGRIKFIDYQLDVLPDTDQRMNRYFLSKNQKLHGNVPFGKPSVTDDPRRAWTAACGGKDRMVAIALTK